MYKISAFEVKDHDQILAFMKAHPFITLIGFDGKSPVATQVPVQVYKNENGLVLVGHVMKKTDHYRALIEYENVLALFTGAHAYVSASVYEVPASASTWNYSSVQAKGIIKLLNNAETKTVIKNLTDSYEDPATSPAAFHKMDEAYIKKHLKAISGFEISVTQLDAVFKLSQNHSTRNKQAIINHLQQQTNADAQEVARRMQDNLPV